VSFPSITIGSEDLFFLPDAVLVVTPTSVAALHYRDLALEYQPKRFVEDDKVPHDATIVDQTWRFVAKNGGPDRRFNGNRQLPVCLYGEITFGSAGGLRGKVQFSNPTSGDRFTKIVSILASLGASGADCKSIVALKPPKSMPTFIFSGCSILLAGVLGIATSGAWSGSIRESPPAVQPERPQVSPPKSATKEIQRADAEQSHISIEPSKRPIGEPLVITPQEFTPTADSAVRALESVPLPRPRPK
jgi:hypothetical protein